MFSSQVLLYQFGLITTGGFNSDMQFGWYRNNTNANFFHKRTARGKKKFVHPSWNQHETQDAQEGTEI